MPRLVRVAGLGEIPEGRGRVVHVRGREIALFRAGGVVYAVKNGCPHLGASLERGAVRDGILTCPGHGWRFDLATGDALDHPPAAVRRYRTEVRDGAVWVEVP